MEWAKPLLTSKRRVSQVMDARIGGQYLQLDAMKVANLAHQCLSAEPKLRPNMEEVVTALQQLQDSTVVGTSQDKPKGSSINESLKGESKVIASPLRT